MQIGVLGFCELGEFIEEYALEFCALIAVLVLFAFEVSEGEFCAAWEGEHVFGFVPDYAWYAYEPLFGSVHQSVW